MALIRAFKDTASLDDLNGVAENVCSALNNQSDPELVDSLTEGQYAALIDFAWTVGYGPFLGSTVCYFVRNGAMHLVQAELLKWVYGKDGGVDNDLIRRRNAELDVWKV